MYEADNIPLMRILTDRGTEYRENMERQEYQLYLAIEDMSTPKPKPEVTNQRNLRALPENFGR